MTIANNWPHKAFVEDLKTYLDPCHRQYHENILNGGGNLWLNGTAESEAVRAGTLAPSATLCRHTTFLTRMLLKKVCGETWVVGGGYCRSEHLVASDVLKPEQCAALASASEPMSTLHGDCRVTPEGQVFGIHYWLEKDGVILDLTADQFGHEAIVMTTVDDARYLREPERSKASYVSSARSTAMKWLHNDFGFHAPANRYFEAINTAHQAFLERYPAVRRLVEPEAELSR